MHILLIHQAFAALDEAGGTRHYELAQHLVKRGHRVTIIASPISYLTGQSRVPQKQLIRKENPADGIEILRTYTYPAFHRSFLHRLVSFFSFMASSFLAGMQVRKVDLVWGTSPPIFQGITAWLLARLKRVPFLFEVRDLWPEFAIAVGVLRNPVLIKASLWLERFLYRQADTVMVNSPGFIQHVTQRGARKVELVANGADPDMFAENSSGDDFRARHGLNGKFVVLYAGAHGMSNDLGIVLSAAAQVRERSDVVFLLVGDGKEKAHLQTQAEREGLTNVLFLPSVPKNQMSAVLAASDACVAILKPLDMYKTTYPNKVFDYMAAGKPVVLAIDGVIRAVVEAARAGIFTPPGNADEIAKAVVALADDPQSATEMGRCGREYLIEHFDRARLADELVRVMESVKKK
jgi:glycosyltransferase involved in cell wall biosynthesis